MISYAIKGGPAPIPTNKTRGFKTFQKLTPSRQGIAGKIIPSSEQNLTNNPKPSLRGIFDSYAIDVSRLSMHFPGGFPVALVRKVKTLLSEDHWDPSDAFPQRGAMLTLLRSLLITGSATIPSIGSDGKGSLSLSWISGRNRLTLDCYGADEISFVLSRERPDGEIERAAGMTRVPRLKEVLSVYDPDIWFN